MRWGNTSGETTFQDYDLWTVAAFGSYYTRARGLSRLELYASLGYTEIIARSGPRSGETVSGLATNAAFTYRFLARAAVTLAFDSGFSETFAEGENFGVVKTRGVTG